MRAAVVTLWGQPPRLLEMPEPEPREGAEIVEVVAAAVHPRARSQAAGTHYTSTDALPLVPGVDGVGRSADGPLRYFVLPDGAQGSMAERVRIDPRRSAVLPAGVDPVVVAAAMNPAMSSWIALRRRIAMPSDARVLVLGATGGAGRLAVQIAKRLGAAHVAAAGRDERRLAGLTAVGADELIPLGADDLPARLADAGRDLDVVLDYVWGEPTATALRAIVPARADDARPLHWVEIGSVAGPTAPIPSAALRATDLRIVGSGQGSVSPREIVSELPGLAAEVMRGGYDLPVRAVPLADVTAAWAEAATTDARIVLVP